MLNTKISSLVSIVVWKTENSNLVKNLLDVKSLQRTSFDETSLLDAYCFVEQQQAVGRSAAVIVSPGEIEDAAGMQIIDWHHPDPVSLDIASASSLVKLSAHKTYILIGLTGDLGQSICQWMVTRGARFLVLASRSPSVDINWLAEIKALGAHVVVMAMDVSDKNSVLQVHEVIQSTLPSIGGAINGANVMRDMSFADLDMERNMDNLDFFILMGSFAGPSGISTRRRQVGSIIHPAQIRGVGYLAAVDAKLQGVVADAIGPLVLSERDLLELFAEAMIAGRPDSGCNPEIIVGWHLTDPAEYPNVNWYTNPKAWSFIKYFRQSEALQSC
ncbi:ketoacyl-synt-domain-containing protein [Penicillium lividum]|nr:ketoacyl-synt-domain-containing protein [Penicillium lividum]